MQHPGLRPEPSSHRGWSCQFAEQIEEGHFREGASIGGHIAGISRASALAVWVPTLDILPLLSPFRHTSG